MVYPPGGPVVRIGVNTGQEYRPMPGIVVNTVSDCGHSYYYLDAVVII